MIKNHLKFAAWMFIVTILWSGGFISLDRLTNTPKVTSVKTEVIPGSVTLDASGSCLDALVSVGVSLKSDKPFKIEISQGQVVEPNCSAAGGCAYKGSITFPPRSLCVINGSGISGKIGTQSGSGIIVTNSINNMDKVDQWRVPLRSISIVVLLFVLIIILIVSYEHWRRRLEAPKDFEGDEEEEE